MAVRKHVCINVVSFLSCPVYIGPQAIETCVAAAGFSVGEFAALVFSGAMDFPEGNRRTSFCLMLDKTIAQLHAVGDKHGEKSYLTFRRQIKSPVYFEIKYQLCFDYMNQLLIRLIGYELSKILLHF